MREEERTGWRRGWWIFWPGNMVTGLVSLVGAVLILVTGGSVAAGVFLLVFGAIFVTVGIYGYRA